MSPDLDAALERDEAYNQQVAATAKTTSIELNRQLAEAWAGSDMDYIRLLMDALHLQFWRDGQTTRALIEARASQLIDNHGGDGGGVRIPRPSRHKSFGPAALNLAAGPFVPILAT